ncbi:hypothetical protein PAAG_01281 [Paracoccidioides lutzii Pb01]|uniref:Uncharacterized protein n=1 Tax=Paracoccidioides lutzii (strain ATCC MYA-826 / Pb01) TaxID=502779 RepID=C1GRY6_PARBA|nr:hypothetical protein PAAG_01281 [Paracoccidioides lutzii Pb01]EEH38360.1 hypothetical protein PAAG_01281 [Paracoccidioides lutzii Pb01]
MSLRKKGAERIPAQRIADITPSTTRDSALFPKQQPWVLRCILIANTDRLSALFRPPSLLHKVHPQLSPTHPSLTLSTPPPSLSLLSLCISTPAILLRVISITHFLVPLFSGSGSGSGSHLHL